MSNWNPLMFMFFTTLHTVGSEVTLDKRSVVGKCASFVIIGIVFLRLLHGHLRMLTERRLRNYERKPTMFPNGTFLSYPEHLPSSLSCGGLFSL